MQAEPDIRCTLARTPSLVIGQPHLIELLLGHELSLLV
jgi:hypothetical protein